MTNIAAMTEMTAEALTVPTGCWPRAVPTFGPADCVLRERNGTCCSVADYLCLRLLRP